jgi:hypothetical protein
VYLTSRPCPTSPPPTGPPSPRASPARLTVDAVLTARDGTRKLRLRTAEGAAIESVLIPNEDRGYTQCISSQIGCALTCRFCATASLGFQRNLATWEIVDQVYQAQDLLQREARASTPAASPTSCSWAWASPCTTTTRSSAPSTS